MSERTLAQVEAKLDELIMRYTRLTEENKVLRQKEHQWIGERARLIEKNELARARIESMLVRLKQIELDTP